VPEDTGFPVESAGPRGRSRSRQVSRPCDMKLQGTVSAGRGSRVDDWD
jgi:hypothetical protein